MILQIIEMQLDTKLIHQLTKQLKCSKANHNQEQIHHLCVQDDCNNKQLCCFICQQESHKKHRMKSIKMLLSQITNQQDLQTEVIVRSAELDSISNHLQRFIEDNKDSIQDCQTVLEGLHQFIENKKKSILRVLELPASLRQILVEGGEVKTRILELYKKYENYLCLEDSKKQKQLNPKTSIYCANLNKIVQQLKQIQLALEKLKKSDRISDSNILSLFPANQTGLKSFRPYFSDTLKASCMNITEKTAEMLTSSGQRVLALQPSLESNNRIKRWKIKITKLASWIGVGACHIKKLKEADWNFNYSATKHGSYFISSNGYSWSSYKPEYNSKFEPFTYKTGDIIKLEYSPRQKILKFEKEIENKTYSLQIEDNGDMLHPAINLTGVGDSVQIID